MTTEHPEDGDDEPTSPSGRNNTMGPAALYLIGAGALLLIALLAFAY